MNQKCSARMRTSAEMQLKLHEVNRYAIPLGRGESALLILCSVFTFILQTLYEIVCMDFTGKD